MKLILITLLAIGFVEPARILSIIPTATKSHYIASSKLLLELARRGHEVVSISPYEEKNAPPTFTWVPIEVKSMIDAAPHLKEALSEKLGFIGGQNRLYNFINIYSDYITKLPKLKSFIENDNSHFDLVIAEEFFQGVFYTFAHKYKAPMILISTFGAGHFINEYMGNSLELSYVPHEFIDLFGELNFMDRIKNFFCTYIDLVMRKYYSVNHQNKLAKEVFHNVQDIPDVEDMERNASLVFINSHFSLSVVRPLLPNIVEIGGIHMNKPEQLPKDLKTLLDNAKDGAVLFSLGSVLDLSIQPKEFIINVLKALGRIEKTVLIKWDSDEKFPITFKNIYPQKWLPQNDLLAHPNMKAFVTHGGLHSAIEAVSNGVPTVCIPFFGDQPLNCKKSERMGFGVAVRNLTETNLYNSLKKILTEKSYKITAEDISKRFTDRHSPVLDTAVYWVEYVIRHKGADFIKGPKRNLYWFQHTFLDIFVTLAVSIFILYKVLLKFFSLVFSKNSVEEESRKKKKKN